MKKKFELVKGEYTGFNEPKVTEKPSSKKLPTPQELLDAPDLRQKLSETFGPVEKYGQPSALNKLEYSLLKGLEAPASLLSSLGSLVSGYNLRPEKTGSELFKERFEGSFEPTNPLEHYLNKLVTQAPTAGLFGPAAVVRTAASAIPASLAGSLFGAPELVQDAIQLGSDITGGIVNKRFLQKGSLAKAEKAADTAMRSAVSEAERPITSSILEGMNKSEKLLETQVDPKIDTAMTNIFKKIKEVFHPIYQKGERGFAKGLNPLKAVDLRKSINAFEKKNPSIWPYTKPIREGINEFITEYGSKNPEFLKHLNKRDQLVAAKAVTSLLEEKLSGFKIPGFEFLTSLPGKALGYGERAAKRLVKYPEVRKIFFDTLKEIPTTFSEESVAHLPRNIVQNLEKIFGKEEIQKSNKISPQSRFELVSGKLI